MVESITIRDSQAGSSAKILAGFGFNCYSFVATDEQGEVELLWAEPEFESGERRPSGSGTPLLFPFPGRLPGMTYVFDGVDYPLESDDGRGNGIHGFVHRRPWRVIEKEDHRVVGQFQASVDEPSLLAHWPSDFAIECEYALRRNTLACRMTIRNPANAGSLPCGLGSHPYFRLPLGEGTSDQCAIRLPTPEEWVLADMLPTGERKPANPDLQRGVPFADLALDNVFTGLEFQDGWFCASIDDAANRRRLSVRFDDAFSECVVYTPPHREAICIEPYTCLPGVGGNADYEHGWLLLAPGQSLTGRMEIELGSVS